MLKGESITTVYPWKESNRLRFEEWKHELLNRLKTEPALAVIGLLSSPCCLGRLSGSAASVDRTER
jgi:hypothetical protein